MSELIYYIYYRHGFKMGKRDGLSRRLRKEKLGINGHFFNRGQLLNLQNNNVEEEENAEDVELDRIDIATLEKKKEL